MSTFRNGRSSVIDRTVGIALRTVKDADAPGRLAGVAGRPRGPEPARAEAAGAWAHDGGTG
ncbi:hypothetical protein Sru01_20350 [Sphaerisporangium rufum]|uniref:Uncharacterized protein n=1 Tax=Sphaerisporangium rufum TaxID=1381558 RepID=A0A919V0S5_9ACTN|nr:hypothetical protein Sru01_20350 [Sphaerisporangium rufum]